MNRCRRCHRPMKHATESGLGPKCEKLLPAPTVERDLFGYDIAAASEQARERVRARIESMTLEAHAAIRAEFRAARVRAGVWAS